MNLLQELSVLSEASTEDRADSLIVKITKGTGVPTKKLRNIFLGGGGEDTNAALEKLEKDGYNSGEAWFANKEWFKKHGVTKAEYDACCKLSESVQIDESNEFDKDHLDSFIEKAQDLVKDVADICNGHVWSQEVKNACEHVNSDEPSIKSAEIKTSVKSLQRQLKEFRGHVSDINESVQLDEGKAYEESSEFDNDIEDVIDYLTKARKITAKAEWADWMKETSKNYSYDAVTASTKVKAAIDAALKEVNKFYDEMSDLG